MAQALGRARAGASTGSRFTGRDRAGFYAGPDRRSGAVAVPPNTREFLLAGSILVVISLPFALTGGRGPVPDSLDAPALNGALGAMTALLAVIVGSVSIVRWRVIGEATSLRVGLGVVLLGPAAALEVGGLVAPRLEHDAFPLILAPAFFVAGLFALGVAFVAPDVEDRVTLRSVALIATAWIVAAALVIQFGPELDTPFGPPRSVSETAGGPTPVRLAILLGLTALATAYTLRGLRRQRWLHTWIGLMLFALALSTALRALAHAPGDVRLMGAEVLALLGLAFAANGSARELAAAYKQQRARLFDTEVRAETVEFRRRVERAAREEQAHDVQSVLMSVQAALRALERDSSTLDRSQRTALSDALGAELTRVRDLLAMDSTPFDARRFLVGEAIAPLAICQRAAGRDVRVSIPATLEAFGHPTVVAEIVENLMTNAARHAPGSPVYVSANPIGLAVHVRVEDCGPGIEPVERDRIFERGTHGDDGGSGLGLFVARRLSRELGGDLWVEDSAHGGAAFVLMLSADDSSSILTMSRPQDAARLVRNGRRAGMGGTGRSGGRDRARYGA